MLIEARVESPYSNPDYHDRGKSKASSIQDIMYRIRLACFFYYLKASSTGYKTFCVWRASFYNARNEDKTQCVSKLLEAREQPFRRRGICDKEMLRK